ncbi:hypothetical protein QOT17_023241 [Balamuthia mandrillaris]
MICCGSTTSREARPFAFTGSACLKPRERAFLAPLPLFLPSTDKRKTVNSAMVPEMNPRKKWGDNYLKRDDEYPPKGLGFSHPVRVVGLQDGSSEWIPGLLLTNPKAT